MNSEMEDVVQNLRVKIAQIETSLQWIVQSLEAQKHNVDKLESIDHALSKFITEIALKERILWSFLVLLGTAFTTAIGLFDLTKITNCLWH